MSVFLRKDDEYVRNINVMEGYMEQTALYLSISTGSPLDATSAWLKNEFTGEGGRFKFVSPIAEINVRDPETGDRRATTASVAKILHLAQAKQTIVSPSLTFYTPAHVKRSWLSQFIELNIERRAVVKKEMFAAKAAKNDVLAENKKHEQNSFKTLNNATSGAHSSPYTILFNKSTHSTLTSICRSATSYGNANNEKLLAGARHYWLPGIAINNILSTIAHTEFETFQTCMDAYNLHYPTVEETMECIIYSTKLYWKNEEGLNRILDLVSKLSPIQRAAFVYIGDLYHLRKHNPEVVRNWLSSMIVPTNEPIAESEVKEVESKLNGDLTALVAMLRPDIVGARDVYTVKCNEPENYRVLLSTGKTVIDACEDYKLLIREIMNTRNVPASIARMPEVIRRVSLVSDTDSTMATVQRWCEWYCGKMYGPTADNIADVMVYIATQNIAHMMASMSTQIGVEKKYLHKYSMKNEFKFSSFALTNKAKHYFSLITSREGQLYDHAELEVKGVALRTSNIPPVIMSEFRSTIYDLSTAISKGENIEIVPLLNRVATLENEVISSVASGSYKYLKTGTVKDKSSYTKPESSSYMYYEWWEETFAGKYGSSGVPSYRVVKVSVNLNNKTLIKRWLAGMKDRELAARLQAWHIKYPKRTYTQLLLPESVVANGGIPKEILDIVDYRNIAFASVEPYYHVLECFGMLYIDKNRTRLVSDFYNANVTNSFKVAA